VLQDILGLLSACYALPATKEKSLALTKYVMAWWWSLSMMEENVAGEGVLCSSCCPECSLDWLP
jgi:hypothetical protein